MSNLPALAMLIPMCTAVFAAGTQVNRIDELFVKAHAQEVETKATGEVITEIHKKVTRIETIVDERLKPA